MSEDEYLDDEEFKLTMARTDKIIDVNNHVIDLLDQIKKLNDLKNHHVIYEKIRNNNVIMIIKKNDSDNYEEDQYNEYELAVISRKNKKNKIMDYLELYPEMKILMTIHHHKAIKLRTHLKSSLEKNMMLDKKRITLNNSF